MLTHPLRSLEQESAAEPDDTLRLADDPCDAAEVRIAERAVRVARTAELAVVGVLAVLGVEVLDVGVDQGKVELLLGGELDLRLFNYRDWTPLTGGQVTIGRRRHSTGETPDIDLSVAPEDPGSDALAADLGPTADETAPPPVAVLVIRLNGDAIFSSEAADDGDEPTMDAPEGGEEGEAEAPDDEAEPGATGPNGTDVTLEPGVNVTFDASSSVATTPSFAWDLGDGNTSHNATVEHAYAEPGTFRVVLTVTDGDNRTATSEVDLVVAMAGPPPGTHLRDAEEAFDGGQVVGGDPAGCGNTQNLNVKRFTWELVDEEEDGTPSIVNHITITGSRGSAGLGHLIILTDPDGEEVARGASIDVEGEFGPGEYTIQWRLCGGFSTFSRATATASYVVRAA